MGIPEGATKVTLELWPLTPTLDSVSPLLVCQLHSPASLGPWERCVKFVLLTSDVHTGKSQQLGALTFIPSPFLPRSALECVSVFSMSSIHYSVSWWQSLKELRCNRWPGLQKGVLGFVSGEPRWGSAILPPGSYLTVTTHSPDVDKDPTSSIYTCT